MKNILKIFIGLISIFFILDASAQALKATLGQVNQLTVKIPNQKAEKCNIDVAFPNGSTAQFDVNGPDYMASISFNPTTEGQNQLAWQGNLRRRGLSSLTGCEGNGKINVYVTPTNEVKAQRWTELASKISDKQKTCISAGLKLIKGDLDFNAISGEINVDVNEPIVKNIRGRCENFADITLQKNQNCKINDRESLCDEAFEITINGETKRFNEDQLLNNIFKKEQVQKVTIENADGKNKRELAEAEEAKRIEAYKNSPQYKKDIAIAKNTFMKLTNKPLAYDCNADESVDVFKSKNNELTTFERYFATGNKDPLVFQILNFTLLDKDSILIETKTNSSNDTLKIGYKFTDKSLQIFNSNYIEKGIYKQTKKDVPFQFICEKNSKLAQIAEAELNGKAAIARMNAVKQAQAAAERDAALQAQKLAEMQAQAGKAIKVSKGREWVSGWSQYVSYLMIQAVADEITIKNVKMNRGRCQVSYAVTNRGAVDFPVRAQFGDTVKVDLDSPPCDLLEVEITTNLGTTSYSLRN